MCVCVCVNYIDSHTYLLTMQGSLNLKVFWNLNDNVNFEEEKMNNIHMNDNVNFEEEKMNNIHTQI